MLGRRFSSGHYRFGFNGKENDREWGDQLIQDYGFRLYNPAIGKFLSVDPISAEYPFYSPYHFAGNTPIWATDLDGLEPKFTNSGGLVYMVQSGQGPTQIAKDIRDNYSGLLSRDGTVSWQELVSKNLASFKGIEGDPMDVNNKSYNSLNLNKGDELDISFLMGGSVPEDSPPTEPVIAITTSSRVQLSFDFLASSSDFIGGAGEGFSKLGGTFRLTNGSYNGNKFSFKHYSSGWRGGSRARISTHSSTNTGGVLGKIGILGTVGYGIYNINKSYNEEGGFGEQTQRTTGNVAGGLVGSSFGAQVGAGIGTLFGGVGAIPGGILGGVLGGILGGYTAEKGVEGLQNYQKDQKP